MFRNYLKLAFRNAGKHKWYTFFNVFGLAVGMACSILILLWTQHELSFDSFHREPDSIYQAYVEKTRSSDDRYIFGTPPALAQYLVENIPEIETAAKIVGWNCMVRAGETSFNEPFSILVDPDFFKIFSFPVIQRDSADLMPRGRFVVIDRSAALKYFGTTRAVGGILTMNGAVDLVVSAVIDVPDCSAFRYNIFIPFEAMDFSESPYLNEAVRWKSLRVATFVRLKKNVDPDVAVHRVSGILKRFNPNRDWILRIDPFRRVHFFGMGGEGGRMQYIFLFFSVGIFILLIGCINFINLATARSEKRIREVGLRKTVGANRRQIIQQFYFESSAQTIMAFVGAVVLAECFVPAFNSLAGKNLTLYLLDVSHLGILAGVIVFTALVSGSYTAIFLSSRSPLDVLRGSPVTGVKKMYLRKGLVVFQFFLATLLIIGTLTVFSQLRFIGDKDLGIDRESLYYVSLTGSNTHNYDVLKAGLLEHPAIVSVAACDRVPSWLSGFTSAVKWEGKPEDERIYFSFTGADVEYVDTLGLKLVAGKTLSSQRFEDQENLIVNQEAARLIGGGAKSVVGARVELWGQEGRIVGVVEDFNFKPLQNRITPLIITARPGTLRDYLLVRCAQGKKEDALNHFKEMWKQVNPGLPFECHSLMHDYEHMYDSEKNLGTLLLYFSGLAIFLSALGLLGLTSYTVEQRTKEFGVRKILGSSSKEIFFMLARQFSLWVSLGIFMAWPAGYWLTEQWLGNFAYRIEPGTGKFLIAGGIAMVIALIAISLQAIRISRNQPVDSLYCE
jgi:ABC-type lipoprotein release transport system permease subunit